MCGGTQTGPNPTDRAKRGSKRHLICDARGVPLAIRLTGADRNDSQEALALVDAIPRLQGRRSGDEVVQLYVADVVRSVSPPVQELKGFRRVTLEPGERKRVEFILTREDLSFYNRMDWVVEPGEFSIRVSNSSVGA